MSVETILKRLDMIASLSAEARKGRFGIYGDMLYVSASDGIGQDGLIEKVNIRLDQWLVDMELFYRVLEGPRGYLDVRAGVRYNGIYSEVITSPDDSEIDRASSEFVDNVGKAVRDRLQEINFRGQLRSALEGRVNDMVGPGVGRPGRLPEIIRAVINRRLSELAAAIRAEDQAATQRLRDEARSRVNAVKNRIANEIAGELKKTLNSTSSVWEDWWDPYVGIRFRYNLNKAWYLTGKADIGGFGVGSEITWQGYAGLGCQLTPRIYAEAGYRYLYTDYDQNGFLYKVTQSGAQITVGVIF